VRRHGRGKNLGHRTDRGDSWRRAERARAGGADLGDVQAINSRDDFIAGEDPVEDDQLPGNLFATGGGRFECREERNLHLCLGTPHFGIVQVKRRLAQTVDRDRQQFRDIPTLVVA